MKPSSSSFPTCERPDAFKNQGTNAIGFLHFFSPNKSSNIYSLWTWGINCSLESVLIGSVCLWSLVWQPSKLVIITTFSLTLSCKHTARWAIPFIISFFSHLPLKFTSGSNSFLSLYSLLDNLPQIYLNGAASTKQMVVNGITAPDSQVFLMTHG